MKKLNLFFVAIILFIVSSCTIYNPDSYCNRYGKDYYPNYIVRPTPPYNVYQNPYWYPYYRVYRRPDVRINVRRSFGVRRHK